MCDGPFAACVYIANRNIGNMTCGFYPGFAGLL